MMIGEDILHRGHSVITLSENAQNMDPLSVLVRNCSILVAPPPLELSNLNLNSSTPNLPSPHHHLNHHSSEKQ